MGLKYMDEGEKGQPMLLPPSYEELVAENHPVRVVNEVIERSDIAALERSYKGGRTSSYHPRLLLKVLVYAYLKIFIRHAISSRCLPNEAAALSHRNSDD